jgi:hypothetical protein
MKIINCQTLGELCEFMLDGEPVFIIRAQDQAALDAVEHYKQDSKLYGGQNMGRVEAAWIRMKEWRDKNPYKIKPAG